MNIAQMVKKALTCPNCGKSRFIAATSWRGHGTGTHGASTYNATSFEPVSEETHCTCGYTEIPKEVEDLHTALLDAYKYRDDTLRKYKGNRTKAAQEARKAARNAVAEADQKYMTAWNLFQETQKATKQQTQA